MITLIRWYIMKAKEIKLKLALYSFLEEALKYAIENRDNIEKKIAQEIVHMIHVSNQTSEKV